MKLIILLTETAILCILMSTQASGTCIRDAPADCSNTTNYFDNYEDTCVENKLVDGLWAELIYIRNRNIGVS